jgi:uncharacterized repeat protein (TIGR03803 family)
MQNEALGFIRRISVRATAATALLMTAVLSLSAQSPVASSAIQAASMPQYASRLHPPSRVRASYKKPSEAFAATHGNWLPPDGIVYSNAGIDGFTDAWTINFGFVVSDTFAVGSGSGISGMSFGAWLFPGDIVTSAEVSFTSEPNGGTTYFDQMLSFSQNGCFTNNFGFSVCEETSGSFSIPGLPPGTYWVNLQNATTPSGDPVYWDENNGPSQAYYSGVGTIPSESFTLTGQGGSPACFSSEGNLQVLFDFTQQQGGGNGVVMDQNGNLYGRNQYGGNRSDGFAYKFSDFGNWILSPLFNFLGGDNGSQPTGAILGPSGDLYGGAAGGIQNCGTDGSQYCGLVYNLRPKPTVCTTATCGWNENVLYRFTGEGDGSGTINASTFDLAGNLYGTTTTGGATGQGTVFELTPSGGGWTKTTLYNFTAHFDGYGPTQVLAGSDGNLYGLASGGVSNDGVVFQLTPSGGQWTESTIYTFGREGDSVPFSLVEDGAGNLYGTARRYTLGAGAAIFMLRKTGSGWAFSQYVVAHNEFDYLGNITIDANGNLYGTGADESDFSGESSSLPPGLSQSYDSYIFKASHDSNGWHYQDLKYLTNQIFPSSGSLALDSSGNLYGTTGACDGVNHGTLWKLSP